MAAPRKSCKTAVLIEESLFDSEKYLLLSDSIKCENVGYLHVRNGGKIAHWSPRLASF